MDSQTIHLGFLLCQFKKYKLGSMDNQDDRLRLQKFIYLLQAHDIYLGYDYSWYLRGPYCTTLAKKGITLEQINESMVNNSKSYFANPVIQKRFDVFKKFIKGRENDDNYLEIVASLHILKVEGFDKDDAVEIVNAKKPKIFTKQYCSKIWDSDVQKLSQNVKMREIIKSTEKYPLKTTRLSLDIDDDDDHSDPTITKDMYYKPADRAMYYMIKDADMDSDFHLVGNNMFRPDEQEPIIDMLMIDHDVVYNIRKNIEYA